MAGYRLAAFDMDGTLLDSNKEIPLSARLAFERAVKAGKILALDTGRALSELAPYPFPELGIRYGACTCGTIIYDFREKKVLAEKTLPSAWIPRLIEEAGKEDCMIQVMKAGISFVEPGDVERMAHFRMGVYQALYAETTAWTEDVRAFALSNRNAVNKINLYHADPEGRQRTKDRLEGLPLDLTFAEETSLEITPKGASKGTGLLDLCRVLGISPAEAIGVGDADNDIPMLLAAGLGAAMGNANENAKRAADVIVADNDHDGIAQVIDRYLLQ